MCSKGVFQGPRVKSSKKNTGKGLIHAVFRKNCIFTKLRGSSPSRYFFLKISRVGLGKHLLNTLDGSDRQKNIGKVESRIRDSRIRSGLIYGNYPIKDPGWEVFGCFDAFKNCFWEIRAVQCVQKVFSKAHAGNLQKKIPGRA